MNINATFLGYFVVCLAIVMVPLGYYFGKRKTGKPVITAVLAGFSAVVPIVALVYLLVLIFKEDLKPDQ